MFATLIFSHPLAYSSLVLGMLSLTPRSVFGFYPDGSKKFRSVTLTFSKIQKQTSGSAPLYS